jgi:hypothetical protein
MGLGSRNERKSGGIVSMTESGLRIWGMTEVGGPFSQQARVKYANSTSIGIDGVFQEIQISETIGLQYSDKKVRVRVREVSLGVDGKWFVEAELLPGQACPWKALLGDVEVTNRRRYLRHPSSDPIELRTSESSAPMSVSMTDICGNGCYVQTALAIPVGTKVIASFWIAQQKKIFSCTVRTSDPGYGLGIEFTGLDESTKKQLQSFLDGRAL